MTATRSPVPVSQLVADISIIDREALDAAEGRSLADLLAQQPGLQMARYGGLGQPSSLFIRGLEARHTLLLVDGVRLGSATLGTPSLDGLSLDMIERIEIVRGPMSAVYGSDAMGGVIQIFTRKGRAGSGALKGHASLSVGTNDYGKAAAGVTWARGEWNLAANVQGLRTRGFSATNAAEPFGSHAPDRDGFDQRSASLNAGWQLHADWRIDASALQSAGRVAFDDGPGADSKARLSNAVQSLRLSGQPVAGWRTAVSASHSHDLYDTLASASPWVDLGVIGTHQRQLSWETRTATTLGEALIVLDRLTQSVSRPGEAFTVSQRQVDGLGLGLSGAQAGHVWQAHWRTDRNSQFGQQSHGALAWGYALTTSLRAGASLATSFTAPSFNQLYYPGYGSPDLQPETGRHGELNLRWTQGAHSLKGAWFDNRYRNFISSGPQPGNIPRAQTRGTSLAYSWQSAALDVEAALDLLDPRNATAQTSSTPNGGKLLPRRAQKSLRLGADWRYADFDLGATLNAHSARFDDAANTVRLGGYASLDLRAQWRLAPAWRLGFGLNNLNNARFETARGYNTPGCEAFISLRYAH